ncbi:hypothetical protein GE21DRAFT_1343672 [Neurospora crassa]|nr:hypothetical protein B14D6.140 [imported] - Neurospora crassa [Neurospora crassa]KHE87613.1 hypothetical protein GE21DRAFT_1343672 [Neurospora crassa]
MNEWQDGRRVVRTTVHRYQPSGILSFSAVRMGYLYTRTIVLSWKHLHLPAPVPSFCEWHEKMQSAAALFPPHHGTPKPPSFVLRHSIPRYCVVFWRLVATPPCERVCKYLRNFQASGHPQTS